MSITKGQHQLFLNLREQQFKAWLAYRNQSASYADDDDVDDEDDDDDDDDGDDDNDDDDDDDDDDEDGDPQPSWGVARVAGARRHGRQFLFHQ